MAESDSKKQKSKKGLVIKSRELQGLWQAPYALGEFKLIDTYLSKIDPRDPNGRRVTFSKQELEKLLGVGLRIEALKKRTNTLQQPLHIEKDRNFANIVLFDKITFEEDEFGEWRFEIQCSEPAMRYFFNLEKIGYFKYQFQRVANLKSIYSYILFQYLMQNSFRREWTESLDKIKSILRVSESKKDTDDGRNDYYNDFRRFNDRILKPAQEELKNKSGLTFTYEVIRHNRRACALRFIVDEVVDVPQNLAENLLDDILNDGRENNQLDDKETAQLAAGQDEPEDLPEVPNNKYEDDPAEDPDAEMRIILAREAKDNIAPGFSDEIFDEFTGIDLQYLLQLAWPLTPESYYKEQVRLVGAEMAHKAGTVMFLKEKILLAKRNKASDLFSYVRTSLDNLAKDGKGREEKNTEDREENNSESEKFFQASLFHGDINKPSDK